MNPTKTVITPISVDNGYTNTNVLDETESTLELIDNGNGSYMIEWDIPEMDTTEHIGIFCEDGTKVVYGYDGVFELSDIHIEFLKENGFDCTEIED